MASRERRRVPFVVVWALVAMVGMSSQDRRPPDIDEEQLVLDGVIVAANAADSIALVRLKSASRARTLRIGQEYAGYVLLEVRRDSALLEGSKSDKRLYLLGERASEPPRPAAPARETGGPEPEASPIRKASSPSGSRLERPWLRRTFSRGEAEARLSKEIPVILRETRVAPQVEGGEVRGLRLDRLPDGTLLGRSGLIPGDILLSINGERLTGVESLVELLPRLREEDEIRLVIERHGETLQLAYALTR